MRGKHDGHWPTQRAKYRYTSANIDTRPRHWGWEVLGNGKRQSCQNPQVVWRLEFSKFRLNSRFFHWPRSDSLHIRTKFGPLYNTSQNFFIPDPLQFSLQQLHLHSEAVAPPACFRRLSEQSAQGRICARDASYLLPCCGTSTSTMLSCVACPDAHRLQNYILPSISLAVCD